MATDQGGLNLARMQAFAETALKRSARLADNEAKRLLRANAEVLRRHLEALSAGPLASPKPLVRLTFRA